MLSKRLDYGMRIMYELAVAPNKFHSARELSDRHHVPEAFLRKILQDLRHAGVVTAQKGRTGGYRLARHPQGVSVSEVVEVLEGPVPRLPCLVGVGCEIDADCPTAPLWRHLEACLTEELKSLTLRNVVEMAKEEKR